MNTDRTKLTMRKQSIRTLSADEMQIAHGGDGGNGIVLGTHGGGGWTRQAPRRS